VGTGTNLQAEKSLELDLHNLSANAS